MILNISKELSIKSYILASWLNFEFELENDDKYGKVRKLRKQGERHAAFLLRTMSKYNNWEKN